MPFYSVIQGYLTSRGRVGAGSACRCCGPNLHAFDGGGNWSTQINQHRHGKACLLCGSNPRLSNHHVVMKIQSTERLSSILHGNPDKLTTNKYGRHCLQRNSYIPFWHSSVRLLRCFFLLVHWKSLKINSFCFYSVKDLACGAFLWMQQKLRFLNTNTKHSEK